ncbi:Lysyl oxidase 2 [Araneus ventricosus]|uniref:Lysyl oxidase 2 n=1 Tax=Araneus ventricosus TaxID=182803 RepID=A0A4Y2CCX2_ARAVE|nr:Lysyl oxidase 2 [Araneus ventricosus]
MDQLNLIFIILLVVSVLLSVECNSTRQRRTRNVREGAIRLVGGRNSYEGNVEIFHLGIWGTICDDEWDIKEANIVCRILGMGNATTATHNGEFGRGRRKIWMDNLYCEGHEKRLQDCRFDGWGVNDCSSSEAAGVACESKNKTKFQSLISKTPATVRPKLELHKEKNIEVRLMGGRYQTEGRVEVKIGKGDWGLICGDGWSLLEANVICQQLEKGYGNAAVQSSFFGGSHEKIVISGIKCTGREANISECTYESFGSNVVCPGREDSIAGVICANELPDLVPDEVEIERSAYLEDRQLLFLQCAMEENCLASEAYKLDKNDYGE